MKSLLPYLCVLGTLLLQHANAVDTPWILGDEQSVACYTLKSKEDIPKPVGLEMHWTAPPPAPLDATRPSQVKYWARVQDNFWSHPSNRALLGADYDKYYRLCLNETGGCDSDDCCIWHSNVHSCRAESGACEPWVKATNATDDTGAKYTLVTHTAALEGGMEEFVQDVQLDAGDWVIIGHVKIMTFQCAVGATRASQVPPQSQDSKMAAILGGALGAVVGAVIIAVIVIFVVRTVNRNAKVAHAPKDDTEKFCSMFVSLKNETRLWETRGDEMPKIMKRTQKVLESHAKKHKCYVVKQFGGATLLVSTDPQNMLDCAAAVAIRLQDEHRDHRQSAVNIPNGSVRKFGSSARKSNVLSDDEGNMSMSASKRSSVYSQSQRKYSVMGGIGGEVEHVPVHYSFGLHYENGHIDYDEERHSYDYTGPCIDGAAITSDRAQGDQLLLTSSVAGTFPDGGVDLDLIEFCTVDGISGQKGTQLHQYNPPGIPARTFEVEEEKEEEAKVDSIAAQLEQAKTGVTKKTVTVLALFIPELEAQAGTMSCQTFGPAYQRKLTRVEGIISSEKGYLHSVAGGRLLVSFNAVKPCPNQAQRAFIVVENLTKLVDANLSAGICRDSTIVGKCSVGDQTVDCLVSKNVAVASGLQRMTALYPGSCCLATGDLHDDICTSALVECVDIVQLPNFVKPKVVMALHPSDAGSMGKSNLNAGDDNGDGEWMYQLEGRNNEFEAANNAFFRIAQANHKVQPPTDPDADLYFINKAEAERREQGDSAAEEDQKTRDSLRNLRTIHAVLQSAGNDAEVLTIEALLEKYQEQRTRVLF